MKIRWWCWVLLLSVITLNVQAQYEIRYKNPIEGGPKQIRDGFILKVGDTWYLTGTINSNEGVQLWESKNLTDWHPIDNGDEGYILRKQDIGWTENRIWAPEILHHKQNRKFYLTVNCRYDNDEENWHGQGLCIAVADKITGPYEVKTGDKPLTGNNDASLFVDDDGQVYMIQTNCVLCKVDLETYQLTTEKHRIVTFGENPEDWDYTKKINEGPCIRKVDGIYYVFWTCNNWGNYVGYATSDKIWDEKTNKPPTFKKYAKNPIFGAATKPFEQHDPPGCPLDEAGHGTPFKGPGGRWWISGFCRSFNKESPYYTPRLFIDPLTYNPETAAFSGQVSWTPQVVTYQAQVKPDIGDFLYVAFKDPGSSGIYFSHSTNGYAWSPLNNGDPWIVPAEHIGKTRDPFIARDPKKGFHMVWTCGNPQIGYVYSEDLVHWGEQRKILLFDGDPKVRNTWAPEILYDHQEERWLVFWSSTIGGKFPETMGQVENKRNHRIYYSTTTDFKTVSHPKLLLEPGYPVIDTTLHEWSDTFVNVVKDERRWPLHKQLRVAFSDTPYGPWTQPSFPITVPWTEGPSVLRLNDEFLIYYDMYRGGQHMGAVRTRDFKTFEDVTDELSVPAKLKHGGFIPITKAEAERLRLAR